MALFSKKKEPEYEEIRSLIGDGDDYHVYHMTMKDRLTAFAIGGVGGAGVAWIFFNSIFVSAIMAVVIGYVAQSIYQDMKMEKRKRSLLLQFKDMLEALTSSYSAGKNTLDAFTDAHEDLMQIYGEDADIVQELAIIVGGMRNNLNAEALLYNFAQRSGLDDVQNFADVFRVAIRQGANIKDIIASTRDIISDKIEIEMEINTMMAGNKNELNIMMVMPLVIIVSLSGMGGGMSASDNSFINVVIKVVCLGMFGLAYYLGKKFTKIDI